MQVLSVGGGIFPEIFGVWPDNRRLKRRSLIRKLQTVELSVYATNLAGL